MRIVRLLFVLFGVTLILLAGCKETSNQRHMIVGDEIIDMRLVNKPRKTRLIN